MGILINSATESLKSNNQDYSVVLQNHILNFKGIIIGDGIGSHFKSEFSSKYCCNKLKELLEKCYNNVQLDFEELFREVKLGLMDFARNTDDFDFNTLDKDNSLGTTLICALDLGEEYLFAYVGNGCIWYIDGRFNQFSKNFYLPWNSINLLNPHCIEQEGQSALYKYISASDTECVPTIIKLSKNRSRPGEIIVIATDGIYSNDSVPVGKDDNEVIWIRGEETMQILYEHLSAFLANDLLTTSSENLRTLLLQYLNSLKEKNVMNDDATLGVIISEKTIEYHQYLYEKAVST